MSKQIYFCGYRLEHFTGWNGIGSPSYSSVATTSSNEQNSLGYISLGNNQVLWGDINNEDYEPIYISAEMYHSQYNHFGNIYLCDTNNGIVGVGFNRNNDNYLYVNAWSGTFDGTSSITRSSLGSIKETFGYTVVRVYRLYIKLYSSNGTSYDKLDAYYSSSNNSYSPVLIGSYSLSSPLSNIKSCFVFKDTIYNTYGYQTLFYMCSANFDLTKSYLDYTTISSPGYTSQWSGNNAPFQQYPISYTSSGGYSSSTNNTSQSYTLTRKLNSTSVTIMPLALITSSNDIATNSSGSISPYFTDGNNSITTSDISTVTTSGNTSNFYFYQNPLTNKNWTTNDINNIQVGLTKIS